MLNPHEQLRILDQYAGLDGLKNETRRLWSEYQNLVKRRDQLTSALDSADSGRELLRYQVSELQEAQLEANEVQALEEQLKHLSGAQEYKQSLDQAHHVLTADPGGAVDAVQQALHRIGSIDLNTQDIENMLNEALINLNESAQQLSQQQDQIDDDPESLTRVESRLNTLHQLARKHRIEPEQLYQHSLDLERQLADLENQSNLLPELNAECDAQHALLQASADKLTMAREKAADLLGSLVSEQIKRLELSDATIAVEIKAKALSAEGQDQVEFLFQANAGGSAKPLSKVASGGELSRVALAIQVCIAEKMQTPTLIFDEVDVGIGGRTAAIVGDMLKTLGAQTQVFVVTHQPQVAAAGTTHLHVSKGIQGTETTSRVSTLTASERVEEIARMLGGISITESTLASARELISG
jgi:DNA repair protein RecN (Recombination protein N)